MLPEINIAPKYLVTDSGASDGTQVKYFYKNKWYKIDRYGGEGECEELASSVLDLCGYAQGNYVVYNQVIINGERGCVSDNFLQDNEVFQSIYRLHYNVMGRDPAAVTSKMDYDDAIEYIIEFVKKYTEVDITTYLADTFILDALILNEDRHFNNLGLIYDGDRYKAAPIFDNGKSLFVGNSKYRASNSPAQNRRIAYAKAFSGSFELNMKYLEKYSTLKLDPDRIRQYLKSYPLNEDNAYSRLYELI